MALPVPEWVSAFWPVTVGIVTVFVVWRRDNNKKVVESAGFTATVETVGKHDLRLRALEDGALQTTWFVKNIDARTEKLEGKADQANNTLQQIMVKLDDQNKVRDRHQ